jgi:NADP-dependent 3-hydroxy acid dehydrogenase YdfG
VLSACRWCWTIDVNIKGVLYGIAAALPHMQRQKAGHVIQPTVMTTISKIPCGAAKAKIEQRAKAKG